MTDWPIAASGYLCTGATVALPLPPILLMAGLSEGPPK